MPQRRLVLSNNDTEDGEPSADASEGEEEAESEEEIFAAAQEMASLVGDSEERPLTREKPRITGYLLLTAFGISTGSFQYGYNLSVLNEPYQVLNDYINRTEYLTSGNYFSDTWLRFYWSAVVSVFALGGAVGACTVGWWSLTFGRKHGCLANTVLGFTATVLIVLSPTFKTYHSLLVGRALMGVHAGLYTGLCPLYLNEISTPSTRGPLGIVHQIGTVSGMLVAEILGFPTLLGQERLWVALMGVAFAPLLIQISVLSFCPESPRFIGKTRKDVFATRKALQRLRGTHDVEDELLKLIDDKESAVKEKSACELIRMKEHRTNLAVAIVVMMSPHIAGSIAVVYYSNIIFSQFGDSRRASYETSSIGATLVVFALLSIWLVNRTGRRFLLLFGLAVMSLSSIVFVLLQELEEREAAVAAVVVFILGFAIGPGPIPFTVVPELFPPDVKRSALSISVPFNWLANFGVGLAFPLLQDSLEHLTFTLFAATSFALLVFLYFLLPETRPGPLEELSFSYQGEDFGEAARASVSIDVYCSNSEGGSPGSNIVDRLRKGFSKSAFLGRGNSRYDKGQNRKKKAKGSTRKDALYHQVRGSEWTEGKPQGSLSDSYQYLSDDWSGNNSGLDGQGRKVHRSKTSKIGNGKDSDNLLKAPVVSDLEKPSSLSIAKGKLLQNNGGDVEYGSGNSGLTSLLNSASSGEQSFNGSLSYERDHPQSIERLYSQIDRLSFASDHYARGEEQEAGDIDPRNFLGSQRTRRSSSQRKSESTWIESCDADEEEE